MTISQLPALNALLNSLSAILLLIGFVLIKQGRRVAHMRVMLAAVCTSAAFLTSYLIYHYHVGNVLYPFHDWTRPIYFLVLIPHVILATLMVPFILALLWFAYRKRFDRHRMLARWVWPVWIYVSVTGVIVYLMLYR